jgi:hypothetical protein
MRHRSALIAERWYFRRVGDNIGQCRELTGERSMALVDIEKPMAIRERDQSRTQQSGRCQSAQIAAAVIERRGAGRRRSGGHLS